MATATEPTQPENEPSDSRQGLLVAGTYRVLARLGSGGMGDVYEAEHVRLGSRVAVKLLRANALADPRAVARFRREARAVAALNGDHVVRVFDCGELPDGTPYLVMERLVGEDLRTLLAREGTLTMRRAVKLMIEACRGLSVVHAAGLVHRDLKPANLFVVRNSDNAEYTKILDFGVAKALTSEATHPGSLLGTVRYMAPEQLEDSASAKATADVYALGAILYECIGGVPAHRGETMQEIMFDILHREPKPLSSLCELPSELEHIIVKALSREPTRRYDSAQKLGEALAPFGPRANAERSIERPDETTLDDAAVVSSLLPRSTRGARRASAWMAAFAMGIGIAVGWLSRGTDPSPPEARAVTAAAQPPVVAAGPVEEKKVDSALALTQSVTMVPPAPPSTAHPTPREKPAPRRAQPATSPPRATPSAAPLGGRFDSTNPYAE